MFRASSAIGIVYHDTVSLTDFLPFSSQTCLTILERERALSLAFQGQKEAGCPIETVPPFSTHLR